MLFCIQGTNLDSCTLKNVKPSFDVPIILFLNISIPVISEASDMFSRNVASGRQEPICPHGVVMRLDIHSQTKKPKKFQPTEIRTFVTGD